ncbi:hypothetical protein [Capnocytophaga catalasegens]|uniref:Nucleotidyltransferase n=1 Tax=Capnocytophaga catalasegens TaxID=1004260 RepID=A0AAV5AVB8_9FLAO|nr:hypothetical protein [Capnocytophaga catalasegens]GIZ15317.1 hypothetical protein RCZ03_13170 [Capnocytophaga catalasegens]GJM50484.1 hypothetical protein RCZ15_14570 [Capnocytophaga catalasegens]GJM52088.1 hypothetical protein RCZ16_04060 [Capnocytophaga catalasegens]
MNFQQEKIFEEDVVNEICDFIFNKVNDVFGKTTDVIICGSVAKMFSGYLPKNYEPKDLDFVVRNYFVWRYLRTNLQKWFPEYKVREIEKERVILYTRTVTLEFWAGANDTRKINNKTNNIKYIDYEYKI